MKRKDAGVIRPRFWCLTLLCIPAFVCGFALPSFSQSTSEIERLIQDKQFASARQLIGQRLAESPSVEDAFLLTQLLGMSFDLEKSRMRAAVAYSSAINIFPTLAEDLKVKHQHNLLSLIDRFNEISNIAINEMRRQGDSVQARALFQTTLSVSGLPKEEYDSQLRAFDVFLEGFEKKGNDAKEISMLLNRAFLSLKTADTMGVFNAFSQQSKIIKDINESPDRLILLKESAIEIIFDSPIIQIDGDTAIVQVNLRQIWVNRGGEMMEIRGKGDIICVREHGTWKILRI